MERPHGRAAAFFQIKRHSITYHLNDKQIETRQYNFKHKEDFHEVKTDAVNTTT